MQTNHILRKELVFGIMLLFIGTSISTTPAHNISIHTLVQNHVSTNRTGSWIELQKLLASDGVEVDNFGWSVSLFGDTALIGAPYNDNGCGSAYVFTRIGTTWTQQAKLMASDGAINDCFGDAVSLYGDTALIGSYQDDDVGTDSGSAYVFTRTGTTWTQQQKLLASDGVAGDTFGFSVSLYMDTALIGASCGDNQYNGYAYVFHRTGTTWIQQTKLSTSDGAPYDFFGWSVSLYNDTALIGAMGDDDNGWNSGSAYIFKQINTTWIQQQKLLPLDNAEDDYFGWSASLDNNTALIGARWDNQSGYYSGSAYVYTCIDNVWNEQQELSASDAEPLDQFGYSVSLCGDTALIGANYANNSGAAYLFTRSQTTWIQQAKVLPSDGERSDNFGMFVALDGNTALIGANGDDYHKGSAYVFIKESANQPPNPPTINGPASGKAGQSYTYTFNSTDPNGDDVYYFIDWGDNTNSSWIGPYASGAAITQSHSWTTKGTYTIKAKAKDIYGNESGWGTLQVTMPLSYEPPHFRFFEWLFEQFPRAFPILRHLLNGNV